MNFSGLFTKNLGLKFVSLVLAVVLWYMTVGREMAEVGITVPLEMVNFPSNMVVANQVPDGVSVRIRGSVTLTRQMAGRQLRFSLDLADAKPGQNTFTLSADSLNLPRGLEVTRLAPSTITVELEKLISKKINLLPVIKGEPVAGYIIEDIALEPRTVLIQGPVSVLDKIDILWTEPIDVTQLKESTTLPTQPALPDVSLTLAEKVEIKATIKIGEKVISRSFKEVPVEAINTDQNFEIIPPAVDLVVRGPMNTMKELDAGKGLHARLNLAELAPGVYKRKVAITHPPDVEVIRVDPETVQVTIIQKAKPPTDEPTQ